MIYQNKIHSDKTPDSGMVNSTPNYEITKYNSIYSNFSSILLIIFFICCGLYYLSLPTTMPIKHVNIEGKFSYLAPVNLKSIIQKKIKGNFFNINVDNLRKFLMSEPWIKQVSVQRVWPGELRLIIDEQIPVAIWNDEALLNNDAKIFKPEKSTYPNNIPYLYGPNGTESIVLEHYKTLINSFSNNELVIKNLTLSERRAWTVIINKDVSINIGRNSFEERVSRFTDLLNEILRNELDEIEYIDLRYTNGFVVNWKKKSNESGIDKKV